MNSLDDDIRTALAHLAEQTNITPPPFDTITRLAATDPVRRRRRRLRHPVLVGTIAGVLVIGAGAAAALSLLDDTSKTLISQAPCGINSEDARMVASGTDSVGNTVEYWVIESAGGSGDLITARTPDGRFAGGALGCGSSEQDHRPDGVPFADAPLDSDGTHTLVRLFGWVPPTAKSAVVSFTDGTKVEVTPSAEGYFLKLLTLPSRFADLVDPIASIDVIGADGTIIDHRDL